MAAENHDPVTEGIPAELKRLWRYGLVLSGNRDTAEELVQATCSGRSNARTSSPPEPASTAG